LAGCARCIGRRQHGVSLLSRPIRILPLVDRNDTDLLTPPRPASIQELKSIRCDGFDLGEAVYSTLVDRCMSTDPDLGNNQVLVDTLFTDSLRIWKRARQLLAEEKFDLVYIFNGRFHTTRAWVRACETMNVHFKVHERTRKLGNMFIFDNSLPQDQRHYLARIKSFVERTKGDDEVRREGIRFFEEKRNSQDSGWHSFTAGQTKGKLPRQWDEKLRNFVFFASTEREFVGAKSFTPAGFYDSQIDAIKDLFPKASAKDPSIQFYLRIHPNSAREKIRWWEHAEITGLPNMHVIAPESTVSTYDLMLAAEKTLCFRSSAGIEAAYWGKPSIILTHAFYEGLDAVYEPSSPEHALELLLARLGPKPRENAIKFGSFLRCGGYTLKHATVAGLSKLRFKDSELTANAEAIDWHDKSFMRPNLGPVVERLWRWVDDIKWKRLVKKYKGWFAAAGFDAKARGFVAPDV